LQEEFGGNAPKDILLNELSDKYNMDEEKAEELITKLKRQGSIYEPKQGYYKVV
jgi:replicative DNA helicase Mcm